VLWTSISTTEGIPSMPHHIQDGDDVKAGSLVMLHQIVKVEVYVPEVIQVCSFCYSCCCVAFATRFQIKQINSIFWRLFFLFCRRFAHLFT